MGMIGAAFPVKLTLKKIEGQLAENERHMECYAHEIQTSTVPGESDYYEEKCEELLKERRWLKLKYLTDLRREIKRMKRKMSGGGEKGVRQARNQLKKKYFRVLRAVA